MAITYPITLPTSPKPASFSLTAEATSAITRSPFTGTQQVAKHQGEHWLAQVRFAPMNRASAALWLAAITSLRGLYGTMKLPAYGHATPQGTGGDGAAAVFDTANNGEVLETANWGRGDELVLKAGDFITVSDQLMQVLADATTDGGGAVDVDVFPRFRGSTAGTPALAPSDAYGLFRLADPAASFDLNAALIYGFQFSAIEAF